MTPGDLVNLTPFDYEHNPDRGFSPRIGIYLGLIPGDRRKEHVAWNISRHRVLCPDGCWDYLTSRWAVEVIR